jgi:Raf kinase inhibitor-like YbhB/YbcL family protein
MNTSILTAGVIAILQVTSPSFTNNGNIPEKFSCQGDNINPALNIKGIPSGTKSLAIVVEDPDAPQGTVTHWIAWDMDANANIPEKSTTGTQGKNTKGNNGYMGPCPPNGTHHYHFKVFALDAKLNLAEGSSKEQLLSAIKGHVLATGELTGLYKKM